jgi:hypothetical protein
MTGDFVCFVDSDDFVEPNYLESLLQGMDDSDACVCGYTTGDAEYYLSSRIYERKRFVQCLFELEDNGLLGYLWNKLFRADIICRQNIRFNERLSLWEDLLFVWDYLLHTEKIRVKEDILYHYISRGGSLMESNISYKAMTCYTFEIRNRLAELAPSDYLPLVHNQFFRYIMICLYNLYVKIHVPKKERMAFLRQLHPFVGHYPYRHPKRRPVSYRFIYRMLALDKGMYISDFVLTVWGKTKKYS